MGVLLSGVLLGITSILLMLYIKKLKKLSIAGTILLYLLSLYAISIYVTAENIIQLIIGIVVGIALCPLYKYIIKDSFVMKLLTTEERGVSASLEEDFMNTKLGKIVTIVVAVLVIYAIASTLCIFRLNQKINSMVVITDELREEIDK